MSFGAPSSDEPDFPQPDKSELYREERLLAAGYSELHALALSRDRSVDLHDAVDLVKVRGCSPEVAASILL